MRHRVQRWWYRTPTGHVGMVIFGVAAVLAFIALIGWYLAR